MLLFEVIHGEVDFNLNVELVSHARSDTKQLTFHHVKIDELVDVEKGCFVFYPKEMYQAT